MSLWNDLVLLLIVTLIQKTINYQKGMVCRAAAAALLWNEWEKEIIFFVMRKIIHKFEGRKMKEEEQI